MKLHLPFYIFLGSFLLLLPTYWHLSNPIQLEEICDNGMDDDGDGLIDLNDPDCACPVIEPVSLIPNPSFETMECCPSTRGQLSCADTWIQASEPTTDYIHTCGWLGWDEFPLPRPIPDGEAVVGFRDGRARMESPDPTWKEYAGACLLGPLKTGVKYRFEFWVGFASYENSPPINIHFFGTNNCDNLPFGVGNEEFGCPTNGPGWQLLGFVYVGGNNNWVKTHIDVTPNQDINAIAIGPGCENRISAVSLYYFFDNLVLDEQAAFEFTIKTNGENPCTNDFALQVPQYDSLHYQWYRDGIALVGENNAIFRPNQAEGQYQVRVTSKSDCRTTAIFPYVKPRFETTIREVICEGEHYTFGATSLKESGVYARTIKTKGNCDSTITLNLSVASNKQDTISAKIFASESYQVGPYYFNQPGNHFSHLSSSYGCDSLVLLQLEWYKVFAPNVFSPNSDGLNDGFTIMGNEDLLAIKSLQVYDRWGNLIFDRKDITPGNTNEGWDGMIASDYGANGVYVFTALLLMEDGIERRFSGSVMLMR
ncbi:MAG: gliding motility-associated C-terminal domain-containing protein [Saprospiraceae bacterium]